jgi:hypothetical protein
MAVLLIWAAWAVTNISRNTNIQSRSGIPERDFKMYPITIKMTDYETKNQPLVLLPENIGKVGQER